MSNSETTELTTAEKRAVNKERKRLKELYPTLTGNFFKGEIKGKINSAYKARAENPDKAKNFKEALEAKEIAWGSKPLTKGLYNKCIEMGIEVPDEMNPNQ